MLQRVSRGLGYYVVSVAISHIVFKPLLHHHVDEQPSPPFFPFCSWHKCSLQGSILDFRRNKKCKKCRWNYCSLCATSSQATGFVYKPCAGLQLLKPSTEQTRHRVY